MTASIWVRVGGGEWGRLFSGLSLQAAVDHAPIEAAAPAELAGGPVRVAVTADGDRPETGPVLFACGSH